MFPRIKSYRNKDGSQRHYLYLVATKRIGGHVRQVTTANFGRLEDVDKVLPDVVKKLAKFTKKLRVINLAQEMKSEWVKEYGPVIIFRRLWDKLGLEEYFARYRGKRKMGFDVGEIIYSMVLNRLLEPASELRTHRWVKNLYGIKEVEDLHHWYRSLDFLIEHKEELESDLYEAGKDLLFSP